MYFTEVIRTSSVYFLNIDSWLLHSYNALPELKMAWISTPIENISDPLQQDMVKANSGAKKSKFGWMIVGSSGSHSLHGNTGSELTNWKINIIYSTEVFIYLEFFLSFTMCVLSSH
jgi:hypothetical protein